MNNTNNKIINLWAELYYDWGWGDYLPSFKKLVTVLESMGYVVKYDIHKFKKTPEETQDIYLILGSDKILVYSNKEAIKIIDDENSIKVADKLILMIYYINWHYMI